ncbi:MAG: arginase family protein [Parvularculaceae bacterium]
MTVALLGFPDASSSHARGPALRRPSSARCSSARRQRPTVLAALTCAEVITAQEFAVLPEDAAKARAEIEARVTAALEGGRRPLSLGGDHSVTFPILRAIAAHYGPVNVLHIDAHPDLYEDYEGDRYSHASPFARALEEGLIANLVQVGIRSSSPEQVALSQKHGGVMLGADEVDAIPYEKLEGPLYVSVDLDGLDPAFAPGVSHPEAGGLSTREVLAIIKRLPAAPVGADVVELNPERDINLLTAHVAARLIKELAAAMA